MKQLVEPIKDKNKLKKIEETLLAKSKRNHLIWVLGINTGLRISDILALNVEDVADKDYIELKEIKTGKYKRFPLNKKLKSCIKDYLDSERAITYSIDIEEPLFVGKKHMRLDRSQVYRFINEVCKEMNCRENVGTHTMRKSFGFHFYKQYNDVALLQKILNHSSPSITLRYIGIAQDEIDTSYINFEL